MSCGLLSDKLNGLKMQNTSGTSPHYSNSKLNGCQFFIGHPGANQKMNSSTQHRLSVKFSQGTSCLYYAPRVGLCLSFFILLATSMEKMLGFFVNSVSSFFVYIFFLVDKNHCKALIATFLQDENNVFTCFTYFSFCCFLSKQHFSLHNPQNVTI